MDMPNTNSPKYHALKNIKENINNAIVPYLTMKSSDITFDERHDIETRIFHTLKNKYPHIAAILYPAYSIDLLRIIAEEYNQTGWEYVYFRTIPDENLTYFVLSMIPVEYDLIQNSLWTCISNTCTEIRSEKPEKGQNDLKTKEKKKKQASTTETSKKNAKTQEEKQIRKPTVHDDFYLQMYLEHENSNISQMLEHHKVSKKTMQKWIRIGQEIYAEQHPDQNIIVTPYKKDDDFHLKIYQESQNNSVSQMAEQYDVSTVTIKNWIHKGEELYAKQNPNPNRTPDKKNDNFYIKIYQEHKHRPLRKQIPVCQRNV